MQEYGFSLTCILPYKDRRIPENTGVNKKTYSLIFYAVILSQAVSILKVGTT